MVALVLLGGSSIQGVDDVADYHNTEVEGRKQMASPTESLLLSESLAQNPGYSQTPPSSPIFPLLMHLELLP